MAALNGKWSLISTDNFEEYMKATGVDDAQRAKINELLAKGGSGGTVEEYFVEPGKSIRRNYYISGTLFREAPAVPIGEEFCEQAINGKVAKATITQEGENKLIRCETFETGTTTEAVMEVNGDEMTTTMKCGSVVATRKCKRV